MRILKHPILDFKTDKQIVSFIFDGKTYNGVLGEPIAAALHDNGIAVLGHSHNGRPRGLYCAIGNCSSCLATVDGVSNVRICTEKLKDGMVIQMQNGKGLIRL